jgi:hypothetical protein
MMVYKTSGFVCNHCDSFFYSEREAINCEIGHKKGFDFEFENNNGIYINSYGICGQVESFILNKEIYQSNWFGDLKD